MLPTQLSTLC
ncbi:TPA: hypothetical protein N0F65_012720 [Lagenidium giganteum]|uniref:Uncharacterized protein n=1 Tax=Lagenidium giganteum TaxID=4803 RepID=A0AAV2YDS7_9STRA|nr:TPA: hypothetical protein N0F65_012720 [Lagenidium giganteum]